VRTLTNRPRSPSNRSTQHAIQQCHRKTTCHWACSGNKELSALHRKAEPIFVLPATALPPHAVMAENDCSTCCRGLQSGVAWSVRMAALTRSWPRTTAARSPRTAARRGKGRARRSCQSPWRRRRQCRSWMKSHAACGSSHCAPFAQLATVHSRLAVQTQSPYDSCGWGSIVAAAMPQGMQGTQRKIAAILIRADCIPDGLLTPREAIKREYKHLDPLEFTR